MLLHKIFRRERYIWFKKNSVAIEKASIDYNKCAATNFSIKSPKRMKNSTLQNILEFKSGVKDIPHNFDPSMFSLF